VLQTKIRKFFPTVRFCSFQFLFGVCISTDKIIALARSQLTSPDFMKVLVKSMACEITWLKKRTLFPRIIPGAEQIRSHYPAFSPYLPLSPAKKYSHWQRFCRTSFRSFQCNIDKRECRSPSLETSPVVGLPACRYSSMLVFSIFLLVRFVIRAAAAKEARNQ
jgi:hypothetical protein